MFKRFPFFLLSSFVCCALFFAACSAGNRPGNLRDRRGLDLSDIEPEVRRREIPKAPWEIWSADNLGDSAIASGDDATRRGELAEAAASYALSYKNAKNDAIREEALLRQVGTLLKLGRSNEVLKLATRHLDAQGVGMDKLPARVAYIVAFAYEHQRDLDQALAWFGLVRKNAMRRPAVDGQVEFLAEREVVRIVQGIAAEDFDATERRWTADAFIGPIFTRETLRRSRGGIPQPVDHAAFYKPETYGEGNDVLVADTGDVETSIEVTGAMAGDGLAIGILLPLTGRFAEHGEKVRQGIELAVEEALRNGVNARLVVADTKGDPAVAGASYRKLVDEQKVSFVLGPLLVRTTHTVAQISQEKGVPFLTFTKREGIPDLGPTVFRLGATAGDQAQELAAYAVSGLGIGSYTTLFPSTETGRELARAFRAAIESRSAVVVDEVSYDANVPDGLAQAFAKIEANPPQGLFIADSVERAWPFLELIPESALSTTTLLGPAAWDDRVALRGYGRLLEGATFVTPFFARSDSPDVQGFVQTYSERFGYDPGLLSAQAFDGARLVLNSSARGGAAPEQLIRGLQSADRFRGVTGDLTVAENGEIARRMSVVRLIKGDPVEVVSAGAAIGFVDYNGENIENLSRGNQ